ncbi:MAG: Tad domain-containing protein [Gammaproteobacteria bacterium]|nr:Tad domain-containing protein [Gammaproteobacteria bacterium]
MIIPIQKMRGAILVMAAFLLVILIGIAAFALDLGRLYVLRTEMQNAVDAAVLSAAAELDGEADALVRAKTAADQAILGHLAHFSNQHALLEDLQATDFTFYSWIGSENDPSVSPCGVEAPEKCDVTDAENASYVQIKLNSDLTNNERYGIDLFFLPALSLVTTDPVATTASTTVAALAGSHRSTVCKYPPMVICDPTEITGTALTPGQMVVLKAQGPSGAWVPGGFGWLVPTAGDLADDPFDDGITQNNKLLAHRLGSKYGQGCTDPVVTLNTGNKENWPRWGLNTRFGIYYKVDGNAGNQSAPNIIDYPRDDELLVPLTCDRDPGIKFGGSWDTMESECFTVPDKQPRQYSRARYDLDFHATGPSVPDPTVVDTRYKYYQWELDNAVTGGLAVKPPVTVPPEITPNERDCPDGDEGVNCRILDGEPTALNKLNDLVDTNNVDERRVLFVATVACVANNIGPWNPVINLNEVDGKWMRFFMTEHVSNPSESVNIYAEFINEVDKDDKDDEHFKKVIQLYE